MHPDRLAMMSRMGADTTLHSNGNGAPPPPRSAGSSSAAPPPSSSVSVPPPPPQHLIHGGPPPPMMHRHREDRHRERRDRDNRRRSRSPRRKRRRSRSHERSRGRNTRHRRSHSSDEETDEEAERRRRRRRKKKKHLGWDVGPMPGQPIAHQASSATSKHAPTGSMANPFVNGGGGGGGMNRGMNPNSITKPGMMIDKRARTVYVGNVQPSILEHDLRSFFLSSLPTVAGRPSTNPDPIHNISMNHQRMYAFIEFDNPDDADICMSFDGFVIKDGLALRIRRPKNYGPVPGHTPKQWKSSLDIIATHVEDGPNKIFLGGLPPHLSAEDIKTLVQSFGPLSAFTLAKDRDGGGSKGYAFFSYKDVSTTPIATAGLNGMEIAGKAITCKVARIHGQDQSAGQTNAAASGGMMPQMPGGMGNANNIPLGNTQRINPFANQQQQMPPQQPGMMGMMGQQPPAMGGMGMNAGGPMMGMPNTMQKPPQGMPPASGMAGAPSRTMVMNNMVTMAELSDDAEYEDIVLDIQDECATYGPLVRVVIPRPGRAPPADVGKVFVEYREVASAVQAVQAMSGRRFAERVIVAGFAPDGSLAF